MRLLPFFLLITFVGTCQGSDFGITNPIHLLRLKSGSAGHRIPGLSCASWRLGVEAHNVIDWKTVPKECEGYVGHYMLGQEYREDSKIVAYEAFLYARSLNLPKDGKNVWVFDVDETSLSNLPYYAKHGFGVEPFNQTSFNQWVYQGTQPALPESLKLYHKLLSLGIKVVFLTGRTRDQKAITAKNLVNVGYHTWEKLIVKSSSYSGKPAVFYKSSERQKLEKKGYRIIGNIGDQWSDILGTDTGNRTFKLPDPMYYIS